MTHLPGPGDGQPQPTPPHQPTAQWQPAPYPPPAWGTPGPGYPVPPPPRPRWGAGRIVLVTLAGLLLLCGALLALVLAVAPLAVETTPPVERDAQGRILEATDVAKDDLRPRDCVNDRALVELEPGGDLQTFGPNVRAVPCAQPHDFEVYAAFTLPEGEYDDAGAVQQAADRQCFRRLRQEWSQDRRLVRDKLVAYYLPPATGPRDSKVVCMLQLASGEPMVGTIR